jgi:hypothetical protein
MSSLGILERWLATGSRKAELACRVFCRKAWMKPVVPLLFPDVPRLLAQQGLMHTYEAYAEAFNDMLEADVRGWLAARTVPRLFVHGTRDRYCAPGDLERILGVTVHSIEGDFPSGSPRPACAPSSPSSRRSRRRPHGAPTSRPQPTERYFVSPAPAPPSWVRNDIR